MVEHAKPLAVTLPRAVVTGSVAALGFVLAAGPAWLDGGYFAGTCAWVAVGSFGIATTLLIARPEVAWEWLDLSWLVGLAAFAAWLTLSAVWSPDLTASLAEIPRVLAYTGIALLTLIVVRARTVPILLASVTAGITVVSGYALLTRLAPDRVGVWEPSVGYRLADPIGYWNGLGIYAALGALLAVGLAARSARRSARFAAGATPLVLVPTVFFTFSRGAWLALAIGIVATFVLDQRRLGYAATVLTLAPWSAIAVVVAWQSDVLNDSTASVAQVAAQGDAYLALLVGLALVSGLAALLAGEVGDRVSIGPVVRRVFAAVLAAGALAAVALAWADHGPPWRAADRAWASFTAPPKATGPILTDRLFDLSSSNRVDLWRVAWDRFEAHPAIGDGAGSFQASWFRERPVALFVRDGHSLFFETVAELGVVGLVVLAAALAIPVVAAVRARGAPPVAAAFAAYTAFLAHAMVDWDWEMGGVTSVALLAGTALVVVARRHDEPTPMPAPARMVMPVVAGALAIVSVFAVLAFVPLDRARKAIAAADYPRAAAEAERAQDWAPWSSEAPQLLGRAEFGLGRREQARRSLRRAAAKSPGNWEIWRDLGLVSPPATARLLFRHALELNPRDEQLRQLLALTRT